MNSKKMIKLPKVFMVVLQIANPIFVIIMKNIMIFYFLNNFDKNGANNFIFLTELDNHQNYQPHFCQNFFHCFITKFFSEILTKIG